LFALALGLLLALPAAAQGPQVVTLDSPAPLVQIRVMVRAGSAADPAGKEGLARLTGQMLIQGGFGDAKAPVTKERLAEITRPWGEGAYPRVSATKEVTVFTMTVPREHVAAYVRQVFQPLFTQPRFEAKELDRLRGEALQSLRSNLRLEQIELVGLVALDNLIHEGTAYAHPDIGTEKGLSQVTADDVRAFYAAHYRPENIVLGVGTADAAAVEPLRAALAGAGKADGGPLARRAVEAPEPVEGREVAILALPNAISTGLHAGFPISVTRKDADYWPLYVANIWFGTHRDSFGHLYNTFRSDRGYNYGDYSYIEHFEGRPFQLFPPPNTPRRFQYFSIWLRPVQHDYAYHLMKAMTWELENVVRSGLTDEQCEQARNKARVLYLSLAETGERLLAYRLDDAFYGMSPGYLEGYLKNIDGVTCAAMNAAIRKHLQARNLKYVVVTSAEMAPKIAAQIAANQPAWGKPPADYQIDSKDDGGEKTYVVPERKLQLLQRDAAWAYFGLDIPRERVRIVPADKLFETFALPK
jgi:zinc protease